MISGPGKSAIRSLDVGWRLLERQSRLAVAQGRVQGLHVAVEIPVVAGIDEALEKIDRLMLPLGPQALTGGVAAQRRRHLERKRAEQGLRDDDQQEWRRDERQTQAGPLLGQSGQSIERTQLLSQVNVLVSEGATETLSESYPVHLLLPARRLAASFSVRVVPRPVNC